MKLNEKLLQLRKERGLSQQQLAEQLDVSRQSVSKWELNESIPDIQNIVAMSVETTRIISIRLSSA